MINPRGHNHQIALLQPDPHPIVLPTTHIEISTTAEDVADLLVLVQVLVEEVLDLLLVPRQQRGRDFDLVPVLVAALRRDLVHGCEVVWEVVVGDAEGGQVGGVDGAAGVVGETLVALQVVVLVRWVGLGGGEGGGVWGFLGGSYGEVVEPVGFHFGCGCCFVSVRVVGVER